MRRLGFSQDEIFDTFTGAGVPSSDVQILLDRVEIDFEDAEFEDQASRLSKEVDEVFSQKLEKVKIELESKLRKMNHHVKSVSNDLDSLEERVEELQGMCSSSASANK